MFELTGNFVKRVAFEKYAGPSSSKNFLDKDNISVYNLPAYSFHTVCAVQQRALVYTGQMIFLIQVDSVYSQKVFAQGNSTCPVGSQSVNSQNISGYDRQASSLHTVCAVQCALRRTLVG